MWRHTINTKVVIFIHVVLVHTMYDAPDDPEKAAEQGFLTVQDIIHDLEYEGDTVYHEDKADSKLD